MDNMTVMTGDVLDLNGYKTYGEYKAALDGELQRSAESFVRIGFLLKMARDTDILTESGYRSVNEFAEKEYGLDKSQVSRFIRINDEFSENGYSDRLQERYRSFGYAKLAMMLLLPAEINEELSSRYSKAEIQAVREEVDEERNITDLEVMLEEKNERQQECSDFGKALYQISRDNPELYLGLHDAVCGTIYDGTNRPVVNKLMDALAPAGEAIISARIAGEGRKMLSIKGADIDPVLVDVRSGEKQACTWNQLINEVEMMCPDAEDARKAWKILYGEPFPDLDTQTRHMEPLAEQKKAEIAPVPPTKEQNYRKASKVTKAKKPEKTREEDVSEDAGKASGQQAKDEQEAADVENEEGRENKARGEACADSGQAEGSSVDFEYADEAYGAAGGTGEDSAGGGADCEGSAGVAPVQPESEQLKGQMHITDYSEYMPDTETDGQEKGAGAAGVDFTDTTGLEQYVEKQKTEIASRIRRAESLCEDGEWDKLVKEAGDIITIANSVINMVEVWNG